MGKTSKVLFLAAAGAVAMPTSSDAAAIPFTGATYSENFDSLPNLPENTALDTIDGPGGGGYFQEVSVPNWRALHSVSPGIPSLPSPPVAEDGPTGFDRLRIGSGGSNVAGFWSFGGPSVLVGENLVGNPERALGSISSNIGGGVGILHYGTRFQNLTGTTLTQFTLSYTGEQWRDGGDPQSGNNTFAETIAFSYSLDPGTTDVDNGTYVNVPQLDMVTPTSGAASGGAGLDGNAPVNQDANSFTVTGINWAPNSVLWIRWVDSPVTGQRDHGMGVDDLSFSASVPEPASLGLLALGAFGALRRRRA